MAKQVSRKVVLAVALGLVAMVPMSAMAANKLIVKDSTGAVDKFVVTENGYIGTGTSNPAVAMHLVGTTDPSTQLRAQSSSTVTAASPGFLFLRNNPNGVGQLPLLGDRLGWFSFGSMDGTTSRASAGVFAYSDGNWVSGASFPSYYTFETTPSGSIYRQERMRITSSGNIGVGTQAPAQKLEVNGGIKLNTSTTKPTCNLTARGTLWFTRGAQNVADKLEVCAKQADENYAWILLF